MCLQIIDLQALIYWFAERTRFELVVGLLLRQFSKLVVSATHPPLHTRRCLRFASAKISIIFELANCLVKNFSFATKKSFGAESKGKCNIS